MPQASLQLELAECRRAEDRDSIRVELVAIQAFPTTRARTTHQRQSRFSISIPTLRLIHAYNISAVPRQTAALSPTADRHGGTSFGESSRLRPVDSTIHHASVIPATEDE